MASIVSAGKSSMPIIEIWEASKEMAAMDAKLDIRIKDIKAKIRKLKEGKH